MTRVRNYDTMGIIGTVKVMPTINKNLEKLSEADILRISEHYLMGWHDLEKEFGFRIKGLNKKRVNFGFEPLDKNKSLDYRIEYVRSHYSDDEIYEIICDYLQHNRVAEERWSGIELFDCRFGRDYVRAFRRLIGSSKYRKLSEEQRVLKLEETQVEKYGGVGLAGQMTKEKAVQTNLQKYGVSNVMQSKVIQERLAEINTTKFGGMSPFNSYDVRLKAAKTRMAKIYTQMEQFAKDGIIQNVNCFESFGEMIIFYKLIERFGRDDVFYQYGVHPSDKRYPFNCDFYIKSLDLFIELNAHYSHHTHWFDLTNPDDVLRRTHMLASGNKRNINAVKTWCETDLMKRNVAKDNHINYLVFWDGTSINVNGKQVPTLKDFYLWFNEYDCDIDRFLKDYPNNTY